MSTKLVIICDKCGARKEIEEKDRRIWKFKYDENRVYDGVETTSVDSTLDLCLECQVKILRKFVNEDELTKFMNLQDFTKRKKIE